MSTLSEPGPNRWRTFLHVLGGALLLVGGLIVAVLLRTHFLLREEVRALTEEYQALSVPHGPRPSHVEAPTPGSFAQGLESLLPELVSREDKYTEEALAQRRCLEVAQYDRPVSQLSAMCRQWLEQDWELMQRVLRLSHARESGRAITNWRLFERPYTWWSLERVLQLAALQTRLLAESGQADAAVEPCLDALAFSRDLGWVGGVQGTLMAAEASDWLFKPCQAALSQASPVRLRTASEALRRIREGWSPYASILHEDNVLLALREACTILDAEEQARLPDSLGECPEQGFTFYPASDHRRLRFRTYAFLQWNRSLRQIESLVALSPGERTARFEALKQREERSWRPLFIPVLSKRELEQADQMDSLQARLDLLLALTWVKLWRAEHGEWPSALPDLYPEHAVPRPTQWRLREGAQGTLDILPADPAFASELSISVSPPGADIRAPPRPAP